MPATSASRSARPGGELAELGHCGALLGLGEIPPPGAVPRLAGELGYENPVSLRTRIDHGFEYRSDPGRGRRIGEEIAAEEVGGEALAVIHGDYWRHIAGIPGLASLMLDRIERGRLAAVNELLARHGVSQALQPVMLRYLE